MSDRLCPRCGEPLAAHAAEHPNCARRRLPGLARWRREPLLLIAVIAITAGLWAITYFLTHAYAARQDHLAREWFQRGQDRLKSNRLDQAVKAFQTAIVYSPDDFAYRLHLAQALIADQQFRQAETYLQALWEEEPDNGRVNLELARLAAARGVFAIAVRYYHGAVYGFWNHDPAARRRQAHLELVQYLLQHKAMPQAESELIALAAELPRDPAWMVRVGDLFQTAGVYDRALLEYSNALALDPRNPAALAGAGQAAFQLGRYEEARQYLRRALAVNPRDQQSAGLLRTADLVLQLDPFAHRLGADERSRRVLRDLQQAQDRLESCAKDRGMAIDVTPPQTRLQSDYAQLLALRRRLSVAALRRQPELVDTAMDLVFRAERDAVQPCGAATGPDHALLLLARRRQGEAP